MPDDAVVMALMGGGANDLLTASNRSNYFAGTLQPFTTRVLYLGPLPASALPAKLYEATLGGWSAASFRGTPNSWGTTPMTQKGDGLWEIDVTFDGVDPRFKSIATQTASRSWSPTPGMPVPGTPACHRNRASVPPRPYWT
jgi:hypothetical protein